MTTVAKWGNSLAIRIPKKMTRRFSLQAGSKVFLIPNDNSIELKTVFPTEKSHTKYDWSDFLIKTHQEDSQNISENIDQILYEIPR